MARTTSGAGRAGRSAPSVLGVALAAGLALALWGVPGQPAGAATTEAAEPRPGDSVATFAGGCFWCMEGPFEKLPGVSAVVSGYTGGHVKDPTYKQVCTGATGHTEAVQVYFDPARISYETLVEVFWRTHDPTDAGGQFADRGSQYRPEIFFHSEAQKKAAEASKQALQASDRFQKPIAVRITPAAKFYRAEEYHQDYYKKNPWRYKAYRNGSGRTAFLERTWADAPPIPGTTEASAKAGASGWTRPSDAELRKRLTPIQFRVARQDGTEPPFRNEFWDNKEPGVYVDVVSGEPLFASTHKFKSGTGWPSFYQPLEPANVVEKMDLTHGMTRIEVRSKLGDSHLGHVFPDGPPPTGKRFCINSASLRFVPAAKLADEGLGQYAELFGASAQPKAGSGSSRPRAGSGSAN